MRPYRFSVPIPAAIAFAFLASAQAQGLPDITQQQIRALLSEKAGRNPAQAKMDSHLVHAAQILRGQPVSPDFPTPPGELESVRRDARDQVEVDIRTDVNPDLLALIGSLGGTVINAFPQYEAVRARLPLLAVERVAERSEVRQIRLAASAHVNAAPARANLLRSLGAAFSTTQEGPDDTGDVAHQANLARQNFGLDGTGVTIGVISDGVDSLLSEQGLGHLPSTVKVIAGQAGSGNEGTAILEVLYTLAPGATLYFATANPSEAQMASNIQALANAGCNIIVDDITYFTEGVFQDDTVAQAVDAVTARGVFYFSAAGNSGSLQASASGTWQGDFVDSGTTVPEAPGAAVHSFGAKNYYDTLTASSQVEYTAPNGTLVAGQYELKWSDPLGQSTNDYDFFITDGQGNVVGSSTNVQTAGMKDPEECIPGSLALNTACATLPPTQGGYTPGTCRIVIVKQPGAAVRTLYLDTERGNLSIATNGATYGHAAAASAFDIASTVAPSFYPQLGCAVFSPSCNNGVDNYSSDGPRQMFYNSAGVAITPGSVTIGSGGGTVLSKPDFTAADCVTTDVSGYSPFCGTSAAAPHAAAIAALVLQAVPTLTPAALRSALTASAIDIQGLPNVNVGAGVVMAPAAVQAACGYGIGSLTSVPGSGGGVSLSIQAGQNCPWTITGLPSWVSGATSGKGAATAVPLNVAANPGAVRSATFSLTAGTVNVASGSIAQASNVAPLVIQTNATLLSGYVGGAYTQDLAASGGVGAYTWTLASGALPAGLAIAGATITGTPTTATGSPFVFTLKVADAVGDVVTSQPFSLAVVGASGGSLARVGVLPQFAAGGGYITTIYVENPTASAVPARLIFHGDNGSTTLPTNTPLTVTQQGDVQAGILLTTLDRVINPNTTLAIQCGQGQAVNVEGWVDVLATANVSGFAVFTYATGGLTTGASGFVTPWEGTVPLQSQLAASTLTLPFDNTTPAYAAPPAQFTTGVAIGSLTGGLITATFYDVNGNQLGTPQTFTLGANWHTALMVNSSAAYSPNGQDWSFTNGHQGVVQFTGPALIGLGLRASPYGTLTAVPAILQ
jgi:hypothetical protein